MAQPAPYLLSAAEYLAQERAASTKHKFSHGQMVALAGASLEHNVIVGNVVAELRAALRDRPCVALPSDMKIVVRASGHYYYPDATVVCGAPEFADEVAPRLRAVRARKERLGGHLPGLVPQPLPRHFSFVAQRAGRRRRNVRSARTSPRRHRTRHTVSVP